MLTRHLVLALALVASLAAPVAAQSFPVTIEHALGETTIPAQPRRVVALGYVDHDYLYSLGVAPVAVREWWVNIPLPPGPGRRKPARPSAPNPRCCLPTKSTLNWCWQPILI